MVMQMELRIREIREDRDISQKEISELLICDQSLYSKYELGKRDLPLRIAAKLAQYYGVSVDYLIGLTDVPEPYPRKGT